MQRNLAATESARLSPMQSVSCCFKGYYHHVRRSTFNKFPAVRCANSAKIICSENTRKFHALQYIENGCILILWVIWRPALGSGGGRTPGASLSVWEYRFRLLGNGFKIKSVTPYFSQSEKGTQPRGGGKFSTRPIEGDGGDDERGEKGRSHS